ncbi:sensor histidine kinase [Paenibacillus sp. J2TS4]|uniref:sensor histidine kinase n=1 Tax=Paenibacillus sp. J2TS4 TaxID=2807194 RepID=UPI001B203740|nr:histidine kinase [Paenibacillus sp. J2TS4]GIP33032.1 sensor histidine kinase [Paenibacillus sp. J2TS4]
MGFKRWLFRLSFKRRVWISFIVLLMLAISASGTMTYFIAAGVVKKNAFELSQNSLNKSAQVLDEKLKQITVSVMTLTISDSFKEMIRNVSAGDSQNYYRLLSLIQTPFSQIQALQPAIQSILITTPIGEFYPTTYLRLKENSFFDSEMYDLITQYQHAVWIKGHEDRFFSGKERVITLVMQPLTEIPLDNVHIIVNINEQALKELVIQNIEQSSQPFYLVSKEGDAVLSSMASLPDEFNHPDFVALINEEEGGHFEYKTKHKAYLVNYAYLSLSPDWVLLTVQSKSDLLKQMNAIKWSSIFIMAGCLIVALFFSNLLTAFLLRPLYRLRNLMIQVEQHNDLSVRFQSDFQDEVSQVGSKFNSMLEEIALLIQEIREGEKKKRKAEIKALQAQIDPHFLYNTLNTIYWKSQLNQLDDVKQMILSLSRMFQLGLNNGLEFTSLEKEVAHVEQYLFIQQKCYENLFDYSIEVEEESLLEAPILKLLLQPLVENSILHGFKNRTSGGKIVVSIWSEENKLVILVTDNGEGMDVETIRRSLKNGSEKQGYALWNIYHRLLLYYGESSEMILESTPGEATSIKLIVDWEGDNGYGDKD